MILSILQADRSFLADLQAVLTLPTKAVAAKAAGSSVEQQEGQDSPADTYMLFSDALTEVVHVRIGPIFGSGRHPSPSPSCGLVNAVLSPMFSRLARQVEASYGATSRQLGMARRLMDGAIERAVRALSQSYDGAFVSQIVLVGEEVRGRRVLRKRRKMKMTSTTATKGQPPLGRWVGVTSCLCDSASKCGCVFLHRCQSRTWSVVWRR